MRSFTTDLLLRVIYTAGYKSDCYRLGWTEMEARFGRFGWNGEDLEECEDEGAEHDGREPDYDNEAPGQSIPGGSGL